MSFQSGLLGAAVALMGAVSLSTPDVMQTHHGHEQRFSSMDGRERFHPELFRQAKVGFPSSRQVAF